MRVLKRGNRGYENISFDKITSRIRYLCKGLDQSVDPTRVTLQTIQNLYDGITTEELDKISAKIAESMKLSHPDYGVLAGRICISNLHKTTPNKFSECMVLHKDRLSSEHYSFIQLYASELNNMIIHENDFNFDYFGFKTLEKAYLYKDNSDRICDRPQYMYMRVAVAIYKDFSKEIKECLEQIKICYKALSQMYFIHATPTLFNACTPNQQLLSCFLLGTEDSIESIMDNLKDTSLISKWSGGIGIHMNCIRARGSKIKGTGGISSGLPKQLKMYNETIRCWDQGGGKRLGACAIYLEVWHGDIIEFLELKLNNGCESERARDLFYAVWVPDLFIKRLKNNEDWSLFSEDTSPYLSDVYDGMSACNKCGKIDTLDKIYYCKDGLIRKYDFNVDPCDHEWKSKDIFTDLYTQYEKEGRSVRSIKAKVISDLICTLRRETGIPYVGYKDHVNRKSNQKNIGTIKSSNLCTEIVEWSSFDSIACCCLASINLRKFLILNPSDPTLSKIDHEKLHDMVKLVAQNLDIIIDINKYPVDKCRKNSQDYRPIGIGIQGLSDLFCEMRIPYLSDIAQKHDVEIMETIYHAALESSMQRASTHGSYKSFENSPAANGKLQFDFWIEDWNHRKVDLNCHFSGRYDWDLLKEKIKTNGLRNSLCVAPMPTVTTSQIMSNSEGSEAGLLVYTKTTLGGKFMVTNSVMIRHLISLGLWSDHIANEIITNNGSLQNINNIPDNIKEIYKTVWELSQKEIMKRAALRAPFIDQSQSLNIHVKDPTNAVLTTILLYGHELGLKTTYYVRSLPSSDPIKNNLSITNACRKDNPNCESCSS